MALAAIAGVGAQYAAELARCFGAVQKQNRTGSSTNAVPSSSSSSGRSGGSSSSSSNEQRLFALVMGQAVAALDQASLRVLLEQGGSAAVQARALRACVRAVLCCVMHCVFGRACVYSVV